MSGGDQDGLVKKQNYFTKLVQLLDEYPKIVIVGADNVGSRHMQQIRKSLRGKAVILMGKNTMIRKAIRGHLQNNPALESLLPHVKGNIGFVFTKDDLSVIKKVIDENKVEAPAKAGAIAPCDVIVPAGNTGLEPTKTSFLQALNIPSKIAKGQVEIVSDVHLIKEGSKVGSSEAALLQMLNIKPFKYGLGIFQIYDNGAVYGPEFLSISDDYIIQKFHGGVSRIASVSLQLGIPTVASLPHSIVRGFKNVVSVSLATEYKIKQLDKLLSASSAKAAAPAPTAAAPAKEEKKPEKVEEPAEEDDADMGLSLFD
jgi:large subunit ribosomal protein LP0